MTFREIDQALFDLVDQETGEILDATAFEALEMERDKKAENMALWVLDLKDESEALNAEIKRLRDRKSATDRKMDSLKRYLQIILGGQKLDGNCVSVSFRSNVSVNITDDEAVIEWAQNSEHEEEVLKYVKPEISKSAIKKLMAEGLEIPGATVETNTSTIIR